MRRLGKHVATMLGLGLLACTLLGSGDDGGCGVPAGGELCTSTGGTWDYLGSDRQLQSPTCGGDAIEVINGGTLFCTCPASAPYWTNGIGCNGNCAGKCVGKPVECSAYTKDFLRLESIHAACLRHKGCKQIGTGVIDAQCGGTPASCQYFGRKESCTQQTGCAWEDSNAWMSADKDPLGVCVGTPRPCTIFPVYDNSAETQAVCARQQGCYYAEAIWPAQPQPLCQGTPEPCSGFGWKATCEQQAGCTWKSLSATP